MSKKKTKLIFRKVRNANLNYKLIENGDKIGVGVSGGKDSLVLLFFVHMLKIYTPLEFDVIPIYIDLGWEMDISNLRDYCSSLNLNLIEEKTNIKNIVFDIKQESNPCSLCSNLRRGAINRTAKSLNCNKLALGHHLDDAVHTMFMSMIFASQYSVFKPKTYLDRIDITVIRPLIYVSENDIKSYIKTLDVLPIKNPCPVDGYTKRQEVKQLVNEIESKFPGAKQNIINSIENVAADSFWK
ncbi:tRNA-(cytosine32)-2-thiocytidine synthetase TtcA [Candidatus Syntrophocurvum alkaliphilum]|uniref:tRNA-(Cytosine32)-2-thiocytidine synthetase TtcA n=1 Tax=Candidatus Syntrophocurvum alkaliphilum TaxID=2293317 RepID=A0A6I6DE09_9FIRM|nr:ATP-binding protein [Candidatus Syntrophocurvum alkaliphilum]QGT99417.1 tRNA-(cytosine32)-2-thiocytidine synthetase TtcA [Candidatus Syntrophocurvum alkaliphilum]